MSDSAAKQDIDPWLPLTLELDAWASAGKLATLWWRDDDAVAAGAKLDKLVEITSSTGLLLAVIPARAETSLSSMLADCKHVQIAQHGYSHTNHAPRGQGLGAWELGLHRGQEAVLADLALGREQLEDLFESSFLPVIVPPWNRISHELFQAVASRGYTGISAFGSPASDQETYGLILANAHCDPIRWKTGARFAGVSKTISQLVTHLEARRTGQIDNHEHTGFLTHHIDLDSEGWEFSARLAAVIDSHPAAQWVSALSVFGNKQ